MNCPRCQKPVSSVKDPSGGRILYCERCGWGFDKARNHLLGLEEEDKLNPDLAAHEAVSRAMFIAGLVLSPVIVLGPYVLLWHAQGWGMPIWMHATYWACMSAYILLAHVTAPTDQGDPSFVQPGVKTRIALLPGRLVAATIRGLWEHFRGSDD